jgi:hypothetical protein
MKKTTTTTGRKMAKTVAGVLGAGGRQRRIPSAAEIRAAPEVCALCGGWSRGTSLRFDHERPGERVRLEMHLCTTCGDRIEKHLKRAIPVRSMEITPTEEAAA